MMWSQIPQESPLRAKDFQTSNLNLKRVRMMNWERMIQGVLVSQLMHCWGRPKVLEVGGAIIRKERREKGKTTSSVYWIL